MGGIGAAMKDALSLTDNLFPQKVSLLASASSLFVFLILEPGHPTPPAHSSGTTAAQADGTGTFTGARAGSAQRFGSGP